jgi:acetylornithine deacetylase/succinyl-diaminopimelate desuccinylase-like protein
VRPLLPALAFVCAVATSCGGEAGPAEPPDRFDSAAAMTLLEEQVALGPRPAGSDASRRLADRLRSELPKGRFQDVPDGLRNVIGTVEGRDPQRTVVVGAHYDTKDEPGFVGANDGASGTAVVVELARHLESRELRPTIVFALFDGEESPRASEDFARDGMRGSTVAAAAFDEAEAMILLDFVGDRDLSIPREANSDPTLWAKLRAAAKRAGHAKHFPSGQVNALLDDHVQFTARGVPSIDLIDFTFDCFHQPCDDLSAVSEKSLDATGETVLELLRSL